MYVRQAKRKEKWQEEGMYHLLKQTKKPKKQNNTLAPIPQRMLRKKQNVH
jgi:hypothetical protein